MKRPLSMLIAAALCSGGGLAHAAARPAPPPETVDKLAWLAGCWQVDGAEPGSGEQ